MSVLGNLFSCRRHWGQKLEREKREAFQRTMQSVRALLEQEDTDTGRAAILDYAITVIGRELSYSVSARMLYDGQTPENSNFIIPAPSAAFCGRKTCSLAGLNVISDTYDGEKLCKAITQVFTQGFRQINNYTGTLYPEIKLVVVENGRHHLSAAAVKNSGSAELQIYSLQKAFPTLKTDGAYWYSDGETPFPVYEYRVAILYELARARNDLMLPEDLDRMAVEEYPLPMENRPNAYREELFTIQFLKLELAIQKRKISLLMGNTKQDRTSPIVPPIQLEDLERRFENLKLNFQDWIETNQFSSRS